jgi:glutathione synthase
MRHLFVLDPLERLLVDADTTIAFMREATRRGDEIDTCGIGALALAPGSRPRARTIETRLPASHAPWYELRDQRLRFLDHYDVVWMRKDPPFDLNFLYATYLLSMVPPATLVVNDPRALRDANEKLLALRFPELCPETLVSSDIGELLEFRASLGGEMVVKPLDGAGGSGVFHVTTSDRNVKAILELSTLQQQRPILAQRFIPEISLGDKRIILVEGEPVGAVLRVPAAGESRANFHAGGTAAETELSARDRQITATIGPTLRELGIVFAGIDVIGDWLTEINVTSPTGIREIQRLGGPKIEELVLDAVAARVRARR